MDYHLSGFPACPDCYNMLEHEPMPIPPETYWRCKHCDMWWDTPTLIYCLVDEEMWDYLEEESYV